MPNFPLLWRKRMRLQTILPLLAALTVFIADAPAPATDLPDHIYNTDETIVVGEEKSTPAAAGTSVSDAGSLSVWGTLNNANGLRIDPDGDVFFASGSGYYGGGGIVVNGSGQTGDPIVDNVLSGVGRGVLILGGEINDNAGIPGTAALFQSTELHKGGVLRLTGDFSEQLTLSSAATGGYVALAGPVTMRDKLDLGVAQLFAYDAAGAPSTAVFMGDVNADKIWARSQDMAFHGEAAAGQMLDVGRQNPENGGGRIWFGSAVKTGFLRVGGVGVNQFDGAVDIAADHGFMQVDNGLKNYAGSDANNYAIVIDGGDNIFNGIVTTNNQNLLIAGGTTLFKASVEVGSANIDIGYDQRIFHDQAALYVFAPPGSADAPSSYDVPSTVVLGGNAVLSAGNINFGDQAVLKLTSDASLAGSVAFGAGSVLQPGINQLSVTGSATFKSGSLYDVTLTAANASLASVDGVAAIENGALVRVGGVDAAKSAAQSF